MHTAQKKDDCITNLMGQLQALKKEQQNYKPIPVIRNVDNGMIQRNYLSIKQDVEDLVEAETGRLLDDPERTSLIIKKG